jgi:hypothetical protein
LNSIAVTDSLSNRNEHLFEAAKSIGRYGGLKWKVFEAIYYHKKRVKTVAEIVQMTGLSRMQVLQSAGALKKAGVVGQAQKGGDTAYVQIESFQHLKPQITALVKSPQKMKELATKRNPSVRLEGVALVKPSANHSGSRRMARAKPRRSPSLKIAFLTTNPERNASLRTDIEVRDVREAVAATVHWDQVEVEHLPAATLETLIDALNEYKPQILHFSGHGGGEALLFDKRGAASDGGVVLDFDLVARVIESANPRPRVLVLSACDTVTGAERFLPGVEAVLAMSASIDDAAACHFSRRFYKSIASGASLERALEQGKLVLEADEYEDFQLPTLLPIAGDAREMCFFN